MSSIALKFSSLVIRTLSKPIANFIKRQAREHDGFRKICISFAQSLHRVDMRMRLGILQDTAAIDKAHAKAAAEAASKKHKPEIPTVKTEAQMKADEKAAAKESVESKPTPKPRIRPLSEAKAVESGANFISETFLFSVAASLILFESWRSRRKENSRREDVADRIAELEESEKAARRALVELEREVLALRAKNGSGTSASKLKRILPRDVWDAPEEDETKEDEKAKSWLSRIATYISARDDGQADKTPGPAEKILDRSDAAVTKKHREAAEAADAATEKATQKPTVKPTERVTS